MRSPQGLRLASDLALTRLLFSEAFGVMALISVVLVGLAMFSDVGIGPAISQSAQGDAAGFLGTAFTINVVRGGLLWLLTCALSWPVAQLYAVPDLVSLLPAALLVHPLIVALARKHRAWDALQDAVFFAMAAVLAGLALWTNSVSHGQVSG